MPISSALLDMETLDSLMSLGAPLPNNHERVLIPSGTAGTAATINRMQDLVASGKRHFPFREFVGSLVRDCPKKDYSCYMQTCFNYCRDKIQYVYDPVGVELIESPWKIIPELGGSGIADCDTICVVVASMAEAMGFPARFVTIKADQVRPDEFSHVFTEVKIPGKGWMGADATMPHEFGWSPEGYPRQNWPATKDSEDQGHDEAVMGMGSAGMYGMADFIDEGAASDSHAIDMYAPLDYGPAVSARPNANVEYTVRPMMHGLGAMGDMREATVSEILSGEYKIRLQRMTAMDREDASRMDGLFDAIQKMPLGPQRDAAKSDYDKANNALIARMKALASAKSTYNEIIVKISGIPGVGELSSKLAGLGALGLGPVLIAAIIAAVGYLVDRLITFMSVWNGNKSAGDGYFDQGSRFVSAFGITIKQIGETVTDIGWLVLVGLAGYVGYEYLKTKGHVGGARA